MKRIICVFFVLLLGLLNVKFAVAATTGKCGDNVTWTFDFGELTISGSGDMYDDVVDEDSETCNLSYHDRIQSNTYFDSVVIESGVTSVGDYAFDWYPHLSKITIADTVKKIGNFSFFRLSALNNIEIPDGVTRIGVGAFNGCSSLKSLEIPDSVTSIGENAFAGCNGIETLKISKNLSKLENGTFLNCSSLENVTIPDSVVEIGPLVFGSTYALETITIPDSVKVINSIAFKDSYVDTVYCSKGSAADNASLYPEFTKIVYLDSNTNSENSEIKSDNNPASKSFQNDITVILNGNTLGFSQPPVIENGTTLVPMRTIFESLGAEVSWDSTTKTVTAAKDDAKMRLTINATTANINGKAVPLSVPAKIINGSTMVPLRFVSESLGATVNWDYETKTITIN